MIKIKIKINKKTCIACGVCAATLPEVFDQPAEGVAQVVKKYKGKVIDDPKLIEKIKEAALMCPTMSIEIIDVK